MKELKWGDRENFDDLPDLSVFAITAGSLYVKIGNRSWDLVTGREHHPWWGVVYLGNLTELGSILSNINHPHL